MGTFLYAGPGRLILHSKSEFFTRPQGLDRTYYSSSNRFALHYTNTGIDAVPQDYILNSQVPDYIVKAGMYLEESYELLTTTLNLPLPPVDEIKDVEIDFYFRKLPNGTYGQTTAEARKPVGNRQQAYTAFAEIHHTLSGPGFYTQGDDALKVTCAHELFHIFQVGIGIWDLNEDMWFYETSATWIEEFAYPEVNDYIQYVNRYLSNWGDPVYEYIYDNVTWLIHLNNIYDGNPTGQIWNAISTRSVWPAITGFLQEKSGDDPWSHNLAAWGMEHLYAAFGSPGFSVFDDGEHYSDISFPAGTVTDYINHDSLNIFISCEPFSSSFHKITNIPSSHIKIRLSSPGKVSGKAWPAGSSLDAAHLSGQFTSVTAHTLPWDLLISIGTDESNIKDTPLQVILELREGDTDLLSLFPNPVSNGNYITVSYNIQTDLVYGQIF
ncbi:MAG TPA: hypothetical protein ENO01_01295, partial [Candidatus Marinimicrobia bacterium]|nr:hypothetical protein [Candidatus Neomarinimicrobiota bacterium]